MSFAECVGLKLSLGDCVGVESNGEGRVGPLCADAMDSRLNYGDYEGMVTSEIRALRQERGLDVDRKWDIWQDGCERGEYVAPFHKHHHSTAIAVSVGRDMLTKGQDLRRSSRSAWML